MRTRTCIILIVGILLAIALCTIPASADVSPLPAGIHAGYLWTADTGGPALALPWELWFIQAKVVDIALGVDAFLGGVTSFEGGTVPVAGGIGLSLSDPSKKGHAAIAATTRGKVAGFVGVQILNLGGGASFVGGRLVPQDGLMVGWDGRGPQFTWSRRF